MAMMEAIECANGDNAAARKLLKRQIRQVPYKPHVSHASSEAAKA